MKDLLSLITGAAIGSLATSLAWTIALGCG